MANHQNFRKLVHNELGKYRKKNFFAAVRKLMPELTPNDLVDSDKVGIRPQLINIREKNWRWTMSLKSLLILCMY